MNAVQGRLHLVEFKLTKYASDLLGVEGGMSLRHLEGRLRAGRFIDANRRELATQLSALTNYAENKVGDFLFNNQAALGITTAYVKLHLGDPGEDATGNAAATTTRTGFTVPAFASGTASNEAAITWASLANAETLSHVSIWDASSAGNPFMYGALTASRTVAVGDTFEIPIGDLDLTFA